MKEIINNENLNLVNNIDKNINKENEQKKFLETTLGKTINTGIDIGIRTLLPDFIEDQVINLKDNLLNYGLKDGIQKTVSDAIDIGKSAIGIVTGNFDNIYQVQEAVRSGGIIDGMSNLLDSVIEKAKQSGLIKTDVARALKQGKNSILNNVEKNIEKTFTDQIETLNYTEKYVNNWKEYFNNKNFEGMEKEFKKIEKQIQKLIPIEKVISDVKTIENLHNLIKNNGKNFELTQEQIQLAEMLK